MKKIVKQVVGIDVSQKELVVMPGTMYDDLSQHLHSGQTFSNTQKGYESLLSWVKKSMDKDIPIRYVMEATGVYHESLAYYLDDQAREVSIILPNKISNFARTLDTKTITDQTASEAIALFGLSRVLDSWSRPTGIYREIRNLTRERNQLIDERTALKNQLHAENSQAEPCKKIIERICKRITLIDKQEKEIQADLNALIKSNEQVKKLVSLLCTLPGVAIVTACSVLAETNGFDLIRNKRQITSYAGLDVKEKQSGTSIKGKPRISKKGNKYLRRSMHMAALSALRCDERFKGLFLRLVSRHGIKMKAIVAVQRKLLEMMFTLYKTNQPYDKNFLHKSKKQSGSEKINQIIEIQVKN